eukprot:jgi/Pico_ML_1/55263/g148.t1
MEHGRANSFACHATLPSLHLDLAWQDEDGLEDGGARVAVLGSGRGGFHHGFDDEGEELSGKQLRFATRVHVKLGECLVHNVQVKERLLDNTGFTVLEVRMSPDLQKAYIRWSCRDGREAEADKAVRSATAKLRQCLSKSLGAKFVPSLEFRREGERNPKQEALEDAFRRASEEREAWEKEGRVLDGHAKDEKNDG